MKYFAYGSNMDPKRMRQRVNKVLKREKGDASLARAEQGEAKRRKETKFL